jgi:DivIVA domain-containing protein
MPHGSRQRTEVGVLALELIGGAVVLLGVALLLAWRLPLLGDEPEDAPDPGIPEGRLLRSDDIPRLRFRIALRGYRMSDVDAALEAVRLSLADREATPAATAAAPAAPSARRVPPRGGPFARFSEQPAAKQQPLSELEDEQNRSDETS